MDEFIRKEELVSRCKALKALAEEEVYQFLEHTSAYRNENSDAGEARRNAYVRALQRNQEAEDLLLWIKDHTVTQNITARWINEFGEIPKGVSEMDELVCSNCHKPTRVRIQRWEENGIKMGRYVPWDECPNCHASMVN